jgi:dihydroorotate dehydrogenase electron transfer subunit
MLADRLRERGCRVDMVLGAATSNRLFGVVDGRRRASSLTITTDDGSQGVKGRVTDVLDDIIDQQDSQVIYGCGPMGMLQGIAEAASSRGIVSQCAVEEAMACGVGVCMTCVLPIIGDDGVTRMTRSCTQGPVFFGDQVRWDALGTVPADCLGSPESATPEAKR